MIYLRYNIVFKNGKEEEYIVEVEPHEIEEKIQVANEVNSAIRHVMREGTEGVIVLDTTNELVMIKVSEIQRLNLIGYNELKQKYDELNV